MPWVTRGLVDANVVNVALQVWMVVGSGVRDRGWCDSSCVPGIGVVVCWTWTADK